MNRNAIIGWSWVAAQGVLLAALILVPGRTDWPTPDWLRVIGSALLAIGLASVILAALRLGDALTPTPVPTDNSTLTTNGFYRYVRHPIYTGVFAIVAGVTIQSGSWVHLAIAGITIAFFDRKAAWEEQQLCNRYSDYLAYAQSTPKFIPQPWRRSAIR